ncbi:MAG TPA: metallophosphoesterase [Abditibacteriaceae bacterium]|jgi:predicted phosphodiesterase|nr:metallophosphoesterase [Abditibacteriaceae bacterium]
MRTALISDIHGYFDVLQTVMKHIETQSCDRVLCLGDMVDGGSQSGEVVQFICDQNILTVRGNHDEDSSSDLTLEAQKYLRELPESLVEDDVIYTHISPRPTKKDIKTDFDAWNVFDDIAYRLIFIGHVHVPAIWGQECAQPISATKHEIIYDQPFQLKPDNRYIICVGAVGQTRDWCPYPRYAIYDSVAQTVSFHAPTISTK